MNVMKEGTVVKNFVSDEELQRRKKENLSYLFTAKKLFKEFLKTPVPFTVSFIDSGGVILFVKGNRKDLFFEEGLIIDENFENTAIFTALKENISVEIKGKEHNFPSFYNWSCAAAPIRDEDGKVTGLVGLSAENMLYPNYAVGIASALAKAIEDEVKLQNLLEEVEFSKKYAEVISEGNKDGVLVLNANAHVLYINDTGANILRVERKDAIGKHVSEIVDFTPVILGVFKTHRGYVDKEFIIESPSRGLLHFLKTAVVLRNKDGEFAGVVDFFREIKRIRKFVTRYIGAEARFAFADIIGGDPKLKEAIRLARTAAHSSSPVLITGETGTGKEMFAQAIHFESNYSNGPFVALNCGAVPRDLAESELFGYEPGAFTDADKNGRPGKFELADGGTLFLDEVEELPPVMQSKLLRVLEDKVITRIGGTRSLKVDVRIISATNDDLDLLIKENSFRRDLYYRLNVIQIHIPPLRKRKGDISLLVNHFLKKLSEELGKKIERVDSSFIEPLMNYDFPGNVRELQNIVERAVNIAKSPILTEEHLPESVFKTKKEVENLELLRKKIIERTLLETNFNISLTAKKVGVSRPTLYKLIKRFGIPIIK